jgi:subtilase family serine protease
MHQRKMFSAMRRKIATGNRGILPGILMEPLEARLLLSAASASLSLTSTAVTSAAIAGSPSELSPAMIEQAYDLNNVIFTVSGAATNATGAGETIAIVDAYADPDIVSDLQTFDANFGITNDDASGHFVLTVLTPQGTPATDAGWATEESLDVEWAHAIAPQADIDLVEATSTSVASLSAAAQYAADLTGVVAVSMSWGDSPEFAGETAYNGDFTTPVGHQGVTFVASSGDDGAPNFPSTSPSVLAVGGTKLVVNSSGDYLSETAWSDSGGGTSPYEGTTKPDVAYDGDPSTGFLMYDSLPYQGVSGWQVVGGTSAGAPQWAGMIALADQGRALRGLGSLDGAAQTIPDLYSFSSGDFHDIGSGNTGLGSPVGERIISDLVGGGITSVASSGGSGSNTPTQLAFAQQPAAAYAGKTLSPVIVDIENANGSISTSANSNVTLSIASGPGSAALSGTATVKANDGVATFSDLSIDTTGTYTLQATDGSLTHADSSTFKIAAIVVPQIRTFLFNSVPLSPAAVAAQRRNITAKLESEGIPITDIDASAASAASEFAASSPVGVLTTDALSAGSDTAAQLQNNADAILLTSDLREDWLTDSRLIVG